MTSVQIWELMAEEKENDIVDPTSTTATTTATTTAPFEAGDHVVLPCNAAGVIPYEHHAIVVSVGQEICGEWTLCVSDFTIDGDGDEGGGCGSGGGIGSVIGSGSGSVSARGLVTSVANIRGEDGTTDPAGAAGWEDRRAPTPATGRRRGLRLLCVGARGWRRIAYADGAPVDCTKVVRRRVEFLLRNPGIIPPYSLVECNCECVAVWCKTGRWTTLQFQRWAGKANLASRVAVAGLSVASWSAIVVPGAAFLLAAGVVAEVVTGVLGDRARRGWEMRTALLNDSFDRTMTTTTTTTIPAMNGGVGRM
jgi:hypothetical protein